MGFFWVRIEWWEKVSLCIPKPWPDEAVDMDCHYWQVKYRPGQDFPGRAFFVERWGWKEWRVRGVLAVLHRSRAIVAEATEQAAIELALERR